MAIAVGGIRYLSYTSAASTSEAQGTNPWTNPASIRTANSSDATASFTGSPPLSRAMTLILSAGGTGRDGLASIPTAAKIVSITISAVWAANGVTSPAGCSAALYSSSAALLGTLSCGIEGTDAQEDFVIAGGSLTGADLNTATIVLNASDSGNGDACGVTADCVWVDVVWRL